MNFKKGIAGKFNKEISFFIVTLLITIIYFIILANGKRIVFCDEVYTYTITNSQRPILQFTLDTWYNGEQVQDMVSQSFGDSLITMLRNVKGDNVHPPLYYIFVYIFSVISIGSASKWIGLLVNILFLLGTVIFLWKIIRHFFDSPVAGLIAAIIYLGNISTMSDAMLIRMYMALTFWVAAFVYANIGIIEGRQRLKDYIFLMLCTVGGFLTQYYFALFAIGFFVVELVAGCVRRKYKAVLKYLGSMVGAVGISTLCWPYWIKAVLSNSHSEAMGEGITGIGSLAQALFKGMGLLQYTMFQKLHVVGAVAVIVLLICFFIKRNQIKAVKDKNASTEVNNEPDCANQGGYCKVVDSLIIRCIVAVILYSFIVYALTPQYLLSTRYFYASAFLELLIIIIALLGITEKNCKAFYIKSKEAVQKSDMVDAVKENRQGVKENGKHTYVVRYVLVMVCMIINVFVFITGSGIDYYGNAKEYDTQRELLESYKDIPWIVCGGENWITATNFFDYIIPSKIMVINENTAYKEDEIMDNAEAFLLIADDRQQKISDSGLYYYIGCTGNFAKSEFLFERNGLSYYIATPEQ